MASGYMSDLNLYNKTKLIKKEIKMKNSLLIIMSVLLLSVATGLAIGTASVAPAHDEFVASIDGSKLPICP